MAMYCGDEVCAVVADIGTSTCRFGQAGQDAPRHVFRSDIGIYREDEVEKYVVGDSALRVVRNDVNMLDPLADGEVNFDSTEALLRHGLDSCLQHVDPKDYPLLLAENQFQTNDQKDTLMELLFEKFDLPATHLCHNATMASFASGRPTSLIVDLGAAATRCVPVVDGYTLHRSAVATHRGGLYFDQVFAEALQVDFSGVSSDMTRANSKKRGRDNGNRAPQVALKPWFECDKGGTVCSNVVGDSFAVSSFFRRMHCLDIVRDMRGWMCFVPPTREKSPVSRVAAGFSKKPSSLSSSSAAMSLSSAVAAIAVSEDGYDLSNIIASIPPYELPDGTQVQSTDEASLVIDQHLFNPHFATSSLKKTSRIVHNLLNIQVKQKKPLLGGEYHISYDNEVDLAGLVMQAVLNADVDARKELLGNILVVGGGALTDGVTLRLQSDLASMLPSHVKAKVVPSLLPVERQHAAWLGGSILGICGSFQQLWISREEYQDHGPGIHRQRCVH
mmetsp:Transcript_19440/g.36237  ORF Transcript_19440/g.36237 Transcript_19440/m.36237 type:complete len:502 (+) Transcript_19440:142-1647(+)